ncbi:hypothetical protein [Kribbella sp. NPDC051718]|uniref:hypothetical protein n=1 Tax=Kribbella sp. NPDC051718 TaxID=3155168 RepID=UPI0034483726
MNLPGKRLLLGTAIAAAALGVGGVAYAAGDDPAPDQGYVTVEEGPGTPSTTHDCPDKDGSGSAQPEQNQATPQSNA